MQDYSKLEEFKRYKLKHSLSPELSDDEIKKINQGVPFQKIVGFINFDDLNISVNRDVLIPRFETQELVEFALTKLRDGMSVLDLCCGSGYIGLTLKHKLKSLNVTLTDISDEAIIQAKENATTNNLEVNILKSDMFKSINDKFDVIISNPPYIPNQVKLSKDVLDHEPASALFAGEDGNDFYRIIIDHAESFIKPGGFLFLEISIDNVQIMKKNGFEIMNDINSKPRIAFKKY